MPFPSFTSESKSIAVISTFSQSSLSLPLCFHSFLQQLSPCTFMEHQQVLKVRLATSLSRISPLTFSAFSPNSTAASPLGPAVTQAPIGNCSNDCVYPLIDLSFISWSQMAITATYTAETVVLIVNKKNNSTRTTTISNTEIDFGKIATPTNLNSDGTVTASVVDNDGSTRIV